MSIGQLYILPINAFFFICNPDIPYKASWPLKIWINLAPSLYMWRCKHLFQHFYEYSDYYKYHMNTFLAKVCTVKAIIFPVVMYGCESWTIKKAESQRIDAFDLWCWRRLLRVPWTARRPNQSILKEISPEYSLEELMLKLKLQYFWPPDAKNLLTGKDHDAGKD